MRIYIVRPGDSIWSISRIYGLKPQDIIDTNGLESSAKLVVGQTLVIPTTEKAYRVKMGDTIWSISRKFGVSEGSIIRLNNISSPYGVYPGRIIRIPMKEKNYGPIQVNAFIQPSTPEKDTQRVNEAGKYLTYIAPFSYHVQPNGSLKSIDDEAVLKAAKANNVAPMLSVTNLSEKNFDTTLINDILNSNSAQRNLIDNILSTLKSKGYYGVIIDFERISPENRTSYNNFMRKLTAELHAQNYLVATALAPKTYDVTAGAWHGAHDYKTLGQIVDFAIIMTYEWGWSGGPPMAVAPINEVKKVIDYAVSVMPPKKIMMGMALYGYDWSLPYTPGGEFAESIGNQEAIDRAGKYGAIIKYDQKSQSPFYNYRDEKGVEHVVWFEDARSVQAKYNLVNRYGLRGVSYWVLAKPFPQNWQVLDSMFQITKIAK
ncbi:LysM peptidoglycan-binding domain-containing protein [Clostridium sp. P21]|uniref:LysM peptidoglycan-binding domain-containing protein n=1 Tax=Clostridium muellerianum TaxID=2716538 RepID=A0A7Y0ENT2_9CLOT|nr:glycoside hydrolase family 18 protein [Clostridium muellerianum]NMM65740.1 LysM peptidoglycan-binding domain-containing protein [Clostridium muellerianum]